MNAVEQAQHYASALITAECRGPGDLPGAMRRVAARIGVSYTCLRRLRYEPPKDIFASVLSKLAAAYEAELRRQQNLIAHELDIAKQAGALSPLARAASALAGSAPPSASP